MNVSNIEEESDLRLLATEFLMHKIGKFTSTSMRNYIDFHASFRDKNFFGRNHPRKHVELSHHYALQPVDLNYSWQWHVPRPRSRVLLVERHLMLKFPVGPKRNVYFQTHFSCFTTYGLMWNSSTGQFAKPGVRRDNTYFSTSILLTGEVFNQAYFPVLVPVGIVGNILSFLVSADTL